MINPMPPSDPGSPKGTVSSRDSLGGSSSDDSSYTGGPVWMEDPSSIRRKSQAISEASTRISVASSRLSVGSAGGGKRPIRAARQAIIAFNMPKDRSPEKAIKAIVEMGHLGAGGAEDVAQFFEQNDGKLDLAKVADYLGGDKETNKEVLRLMLERLDFSSTPLDSARLRGSNLRPLFGHSAMGAAAAAAAARLSRLHRLLLIFSRRVAPRRARRCAV
jgi:Sec7-like guanine-nucleotide exchange factor